MLKSYPGAYVLTIRVLLYFVLLISGSFFGSSSGEYDPSTSFLNSSRSVITDTPSVQYAPLIVLLSSILRLNFGTFSNGHSVLLPVSMSTLSYVPPIYVPVASYNALYSFCVCDVVYSVTAPVSLAI